MHPISPGWDHYGDEELIRIEPSFAILHNCALPKRIVNIGLPTKLALVAQFIRPEERMDSWTH